MSDNIYWMDDSILDPFQVKNRRRIQSVMKMLSKLKETDLEEFTSRVAINSGIDKYTVRKYLGFLETAKKIQIRDGRIIWKDEDSSNAKSKTKD